MDDRCSIPGCRGEVGLVYMDTGICEAHWNQFTADDAAHDALRRALGIEDVPPATEEPMEQETKTATADADGNSAPAGSPAQEGKDMATKTTRKRSTKKTTTRRKTAATKPAKTAKPKKEKASKEELCVFALRLTEAERIKLHETAGPRAGTRFARQVLVAAANEDPAGFKAALEEARLHRQ